LVCANDESDGDTDRNQPGHRDPVPATAESGWTTETPEKGDRLTISAEARKGMVDEIAE
jgi:hypothetical protein